MSRPRLPLWLVTDRLDQCRAALDLAVRLFAQRLELPAAAWSTDLVASAEEAGIELLGTGPGGVPIRRDGEPVREPRVRVGAEGVGRDPFRIACQAEFEASAPDHPWIEIDPRLPPAASVEAMVTEHRMHLVGAWAGGAAGVRLGPWPWWDEISPFADPEGPLGAELLRFRRAEAALPIGCFEDPTRLLVEPDRPDEEDRRRIREAWLTLKLAGITPQRVTAAEATRKVMNRARLVVVPGTWDFPSERWVNLGGWVRGGGVLLLGFDDRSLEGGLANGHGPPGPGFLTRLTGQEPRGARAARALARDLVRLRVPRGAKTMGELREVRIPVAAPRFAWPLAAPTEAGDTPTTGRCRPVSWLAEGPWGEPGLWLHELQKGRVVASSLPLEALLADLSAPYSEAVPEARDGGRRVAVDLARLLAGALRTAGALEPQVRTDPFTELRVATARGGLPVGALVVNRGSDRTPGRLPVPGLDRFEAEDLLAGRPVALMNGSLVCPVPAADYRVLSLRLRERS